MKKSKFIISTIFLIVILISCEDLPPNEYIPDNIVQALLIVDEPIQNITLMRSQPVDKPFIFDSSMVKDAHVVISGDGREFELKYRTREDGSIGYYYPDTNYKVKPQIEYNLKITLKDGKIITGSTITPPRTKWTYLPKDIYQFPLDTIKLTSKDSLAWEKVPGFDFYIVSVNNLDTLNYGKYLVPPSDEKNRRIEKPFLDDYFFRETTFINPILNNKTPIFWNVFKWFGKHELIIYVPDYNFLRWYMQSVTKLEADPLLTSVEGAYGYFGSASLIKHRFFLLKNQP